MTDVLLVLRKLGILRDHAARVARRRPVDPAAFADIDVQDALAMSLLVAIQEASDIAMHIVSDEGWGVPSSYADGFMALASRGVLEAALAQQLARMAGLRNRLAHAYAFVDADRLHAELPAGLESLERFARAIAAHVGRAPGEIG